MGKIPKRPSRFIIGLTGIFGSGKSTVVKIFRSQGAHVIDCDQLVREAYKRNTALAKQVQKLFRLKKLDKSEIARSVFQNQTKRKKLEALIHPYVFKRIVQKLRLIQYGVVVVEMPLLFETGFERQLDAVIVVAGRKSVIQKRLRRKGFSDREIQSRWQAQWPLQGKVNRADFVIENSGGLSDAKKQVLKILRKLKAK